jgi:hypothetical protein
MLSHIISRCRPILSLHLVIIFGLIQVYGDYSFLPVGLGFLLGALFVFAADLIMPRVNKNKT